MAARAFALMLLRRLLLPIALALPAVAILLWQAQVQRVERAPLKATAEALVAQTADLHDFGRLQALSLTRKQIVEVLQASLPGTAALLSAAGSLPADVQLLRLEMDGATAQIVVQGDEAALLGTVATLAAHGLSDIRFLSDRADNGGRHLATLQAQLRSEAGP